MRRRAPAACQVEATRRAEDVVARVRAARPGEELVVVFGSGCCEGTAPHLFAGYALTPERERVVEELPRDAGLSPLRVMRMVTR